MSLHHDFLVTRAREARTEAESATLDNVRDRFLRAAVAWETMAARLLKTEVYRVNQAAAKEAATARNIAPASSVSQSGDAS